MSSVAADDMSPVVAEDISSIAAERMSFTEAEDRLSVATRGLPRAALQDMSCFATGRMFPVAQRIHALKIRAVQEPLSPRAQKPLDSWAREPMGL